MPKRFTITIDTERINIAQDDENMNKMEEWHNQQLIEIIKTDVMDTEFGRAQDPSRFWNKSQRYHEDMGEGFADHSRADHAVAGDEEDHTHEEMLKVMFPEFENLGENAKRRAFRDVMHLATHRMYERDFFVTKDRHFIDKREKLEEFCVTILTPKECVEKLEPLILRAIESEQK